MKHHARGFTLTELLVAIGILFLLVALIIPAAQAVRESANNTVCQTNLRQLLTAWHQYSGDNDGRICLPEERQTSPLGTVGYVPWAKLVGDYLPGEIHARSFDDPGDPGGSPGWSWIAGGTPDGDRIYGRRSAFDCPSNKKAVYYVTNPDYGYNLFAFGGYDNAAFRSFPAQSAIPNPSRQLVFMDIHFGEGSTDKLYSYILLSNSPGNWASPHRGRMNIGFADAHVEAWDREKLLDASSGASALQDAPWMAR